MSWKALGNIILLVIAAAVLVTFYQVDRDHRTRDLATEGWSLARQIADRIPAEVAGHTRGPEDATKYLPGGAKDLPAHVESIWIVKDGLVVVRFKSPDALSGKSLEIRITGKDGKFERECRAPQIHPGLLPSFCRPGGGPSTVEVGK